MKTTKEKSDELVDVNRTYINKYVTLFSSDEVYLATLCAILSVKHTIEVLNALYEQQSIVSDVDDYMILITTTKAINEQTELLKELESRI